MNNETGVPTHNQPSDEFETFQDEPGFTLTDFLQIIQVRRQLIIGVAAVFLVLVGIVTFTLTPLYSGDALVILDQRKNNVTDVNAVLSGLSGDQSTVQNQIQILRSRTLMGHVIEKAHLQNDPEFNPDANESVFRFLSFLNPMTWFPEAVDTKTAADEAAAAHNKIVDKLLSRMSVSAVGLSQAINIEFQSENAAKAARITNAIADAYVEDQLNAKFEATQKATKWLADRLQQLNTQVQAADAAVAQYKADHNLTETAKGGSVVDQQLGDLNSQLIIAKSNLAEQMAKLSRVQQLTRAGRSADVTQVVDSPLITQLRGQETDLLRKEAELSTKYGARHPKMLDLESQKRNLQAKIGEEVNRVVQTVANDVSIAKARVDSLQQSLDGLEGQAGTQNQARVKLKQLEANATSTRSLYEAFLSRFKETQDQAGIQTPDARILSRAEIAEVPSFPNKRLIFGVAIPASLLLAFMAAMLAERLDNGFRTTAQVEGTLGLPVLATIPELKADDTAAPIDAIIDKPLSHFAEAIRSIQLGLTQVNVDDPPKVILVTSSAPSEGKTTVAVSLARLYARSGKKVVLVDGDLRRPNVAKMMGIEDTTHGIVEALTSANGLEDCLHKDPKSGVFVLPSTTKAVSPPELLASDAMKNLLKALRQYADIVVIDSAPLLPVNDTKLLTRLVDTVLFVVRWEKTPRDAAAASVRSLADMNAPVAGIVMSRTDLSRYHYYNYGYQNYANYATYYND